MTGPPERNRLERNRPGCKRCGASLSKFSAPSAMYEFVTTWRLDVPIDRVWPEIRESEAWPEWWRGVLKVEKLRDGDADGIGAIHRSTWKSVLPYRLVFDSEVVRVEDLKVIEIRAFGELEGSGIWTLTARDDSSTIVRYDWRVETNKAWMKTLAPLLKPFFRWNHDVIMGWGGEGLARRLNCRLLENR